MPEIADILNGLDEVNIGRRSVELKLRDPQDVVEERLKQAGPPQLAQAAATPSAPMNQMLREGVGGRNALPQDQAPQQQPSGVSSFLSKLGIGGSGSGSGGDSMLSKIAPYILPILAGVGAAARPSIGRGVAAGIGALDTMNLGKYREAQEQRLATQDQRIQSMLPYDLENKMAQTEKYKSETGLGPIKQAEIQSKIDKAKGELGLLPTKQAEIEARTRKSEGETDLLPLRGDYLKAKIATADQEKRHTPQYFEGADKKPMWIEPGQPIPEGARKGKAPEELDLTHAAIDAMARRYMIDGTMPGLGLGAKATLARSKVMNQVAEIMAQEGFTPQDLKTNQILAGGLRSETNRLLGQRGPMLAFAKTADENLKIAEDLSVKVGRTGAPVVNRWLLAGKKQIAGDPDVAAFDAAVRTSINEYAKVTSSATGGGVTSDQARKEVEDMLNSAQTPAQFKKVVATLRQEMGNRISGYESSLNRIKEASGQVGKKGTATPAKSSWKGAGTYKINGNPVFLNTEAEMKQYLERGGQ